MMEISIKDKKRIMEHLKEHQTYPASKKELMANCNELEDIDKADKKMMETIPNRIYKSTDDVMRTIGLSM